MTDTTVNAGALEKALGAARGIRHAAIDVAGGDAVAAMLGGGSVEPMASIIEAAIRAYLAALPQEPVSEIVKRLRHLVSLNEPRNGGPYAGAAAAECVKAMAEAAAHIATLEDRVNAIGKERDEADRKAGSAQRRLDSLEGNERLRESWMEERKLEVGLGHWDTFDEAWDTLKNRAEAAEAQLSRVQSDCDEMRKALEPFAFAADCLPPDEEDFKIVAVVPGGHHAAKFKLVQERLTAGNFRAARKALSQTGRG